MAPFGHILLLGITFDPLVFPYMTVLGKELNIHGACTSKPSEFDAMLEFASKNGVKPIVEKFPMTEDGAAKAIAKLKDGSIRYRAVLAA